MCRFQADDEAKSRIYVDLTTLSSAEPTLAALAYLSKVADAASDRWTPTPRRGYCKDLSGSSTLRTRSVRPGGGWVGQGRSATTSSSACASFPDLSVHRRVGAGLPLRRHAFAAPTWRRRWSTSPAADLPPVFPTGDRARRRRTAPDRACRPIRSPMSAGPVGRRHACRRLRRDATAGREPTGMSSRAGDLGDDGPAERSRLALRSLISRADGRARVSRRPTPAPRSSPMSRLESFALLRLPCVRLSVMEAGERRAG